MYSTPRPWTAAKATSRSPVSPALAHLAGTTATASPALRIEEVRAILRACRDAPTRPLPASLVAATSPSPDAAVEAPSDIARYAPDLALDLLVRRGEAGRAVTLACKVLDPLSHSTAAIPWPQLDVLRAWLAAAAGVDADDVSVAGLLARDVHGDMSGSDGDGEDDESADVLAAKALRDLDRAITEYPHTVRAAE
ncbi:hypothetical protein H9P43_003734 [Blastocladiella emersonii ATCC 22665]|nr:hypothetical protein H9P43_003734 [Blastocladiella emersonii ATCC 22665]